ncbi:dethiobiotin synthase [Shewanella sp. Isolate11]|uniref:dethiobiotin synthase n=1 Tax=Shewanella sp. Isolate11 TaxID=2908530 RepID=UPI001EFD09BA|nr:dethiobiotin synthase [Shewanella sp. Isolate11]MCG9696426.1 dethiobiotin synthase [Shewanella sp. Isolate11]
MTYFIAGTDTDCGKTFVASALLHRAKQNGTTLGVKPIASGCEVTEQGLRNSDALSLMAQSSLQLAYEQVNPFAFVPAIAPHIAAKKIGLSLTPQVIVEHLKSLPFAEVDFALVEGAGGWRLPLGEGAYLSDVVKQLNLPVILVVGVKLGALNHALLTQEALLADGIRIAGWVANIVDIAMSEPEENLASLEQMMSSPCLGIIPHLAEGDAVQAAEFLDLNLLK